MSKQSDASSPRFEARYTPTLPLLTEAYRHTMPRWFLALMIVFIALMLGLGVLSLILFRAEGKNLARGIALIALGLAYAVYLFLRPRLFARKRMKMVRELYEQAPAVVYQFFDDRIQVTGSSEEKMALPYEKILRVQETEHLLLLWRAQRMYHPLERSTLAPRDQEALRAFLAEKAPAARFPRRKRASAPSRQDP